MSGGNFLSGAVGTIALVVATTSCLEEPPIPAIDVVLKVESDPGVPLPGAVITREQKDLAATDATGRARLSIRGHEGSILDYFVRCPPEYESPTRPIPVILRKVVDKNKPAEYPVACPPLIRKFVVAVRAEGGPHLPITYLQQKVATTDASGSATILLNMRPGDQFELGIDTSAKGYERVRPQMPIFAFQVQPKDEIINLNARFTLQKGKITYGPAKQFPKELINRVKDID